MHRPQEIQRVLSVVNLSEIAPVGHWLMQLLHLSHSLAVISGRRGTFLAVLYGRFPLIFICWISLTVSICDKIRDVCTEKFCIFSISDLSGLFAATSGIIEC